MIYVPMLKGRTEEFGALMKLNECFSDRIIPLIEILKKEQEMQFAIDAKTGDFIWELHGKRRRRKKEPVRETTLEELVKRMNGKKAFVDFFRFSRKVYGTKVNISAADIAWRVSNNVNSYKAYLQQVKNYPSLIPVISIKKEFEFELNELLQLISELQTENDSIALRFTEEYIGLCKEGVEKLLRKSDYVLFDIGEQTPDTKFIELDELMQINTKAKRILLNSPRKRRISNKEYPEAELTTLINDNARVIAEENEMDGYGDYCGLKDVMPERGGNNGKAAALAILYQFEDNGFYAFSNHNTELGMRGYSEVIQRIQEMKDVLNPDGNCPAFMKMNELPGSGNFGNWNNITVTRTIHQVYRYL